MTRVLSGVILVGALLATASCATPVPEEDVQPGERPAIESDEAGMCYVLKPDEIEGCPETFLVVVELVAAGDRTTHSETVTVRWP